MLSGPAAVPPGGGGGAGDIGPAANRVKPSRDRVRALIPRLRLSGGEEAGVCLRW